MAAPSLTEMPAEIPAGTTVEYTRTLPDYPADDGWTLEVALRGASVIDATTAQSGKAFVVTLTAAQTATLTAGTYQWQERVTKAGKKYLAACGTAVVLLDLVTAGPGAAQSFEEKKLAALEAALLTSSSDIVEYEIDGVHVKRSRQDAMKERNQLAWAVYKQRNPGSIGEDIPVQFTRP